ncbi:DUF1659 domain-containing protein [Salinibacillus xinjiangensis]|uniref:DUF1659 domain-containing protein n=1 Tax=Salinibacillus xinjiangensis TaxID=1229268 RepID=A0A6G1X5C9_9BACI|nr:DUF1659 domain-containing protein [Salinibacillus xinjiangensis]MRG86028.1 DUF1659 domain-containing protein [Salinibacillus xinjiangensis]
MAMAQPLRSSLKLIFETGVGDDGNMEYKSKSFNNVKTDATPDQLMAITNAVTPLQQLALYEVQRNDSAIILE